MKVLNIIPFLFFYHLGFSQVVSVERKTVVYKPVYLAHNHYGRMNPTPNEHHLFEQKLGIGLRLNSIILEGEKISLSKLENPAMFGFGLNIRGDISMRVALELSFDYLTMEKEDYRQVTMPLMLSLLYYFFPETRFNPYLLGGLGIHITQLKYFEGKFVHELWELAFQGGGGLQIKLSPELSIYGDVRFLTIYKNINKVADIKSECYKKINSGECSLNTFNPDDKFNLGVQFGAGIIYYF